MPLSRRAQCLRRDQRRHDDKQLHEKRNASAYAERPELAVRRMLANGLAPSAVIRSESGPVDEPGRRCTCCGHVDRCMTDLGRPSTGRAWRQYCANGMHSANYRGCVRSFDPWLTAFLPKDRRWLKGNDFMRRKVYFKFFLTQNSILI
jgi:hypothetical protein